jgi:hypothetical protein
MVGGAGYVVLINKKCVTNLQSERLKGKPRMKDSGLDRRTLTCSSRKYTVEDMDSIHVAKDSVKWRLF